MNNIKKNRQAGIRREEWKQGEQRKAARKREEQRRKEKKNAIRFLKD